MPTPIELFTSAEKLRELLQGKMIEVEFHPPHSSALNFPGATVSEIVQTEEGEELEPLLTIKGEYGFIKELVEDHLGLTCVSRSHTHWDYWRTPGS